MTKEMIIKRLEKLVAASQVAGYNTEIKINEWENYGKSRTYFSIVRTRENSRHYEKIDCGYFDNKSEEYVAGKARDLSEDSVYDFGGNNLVVLVEKVVVEATEVEETVETVEVAETTVATVKYNKSEIFKKAWKMVKETAITISAALRKAWAEAKANVEVVEMSEEIRTKYNNAMTAIKYAYDLFVEKKVTAERAIAMLEQAKKMFPTMVSVKNVIAKFQFETEKYINAINA